MANQLEARPHERIDRWAVSMHEPLDKIEFLRRAMSSELRFTPGQRNEYSNVGYSVLAAIIEEVSGRSYEEYLIQVSAQG